MAPRDRLYRRLLHLYPTEFRDEYGREMAQLFRDRVRHERAARVWLDVARDLLTTAPKEQYQVLTNDLRYALRTLRRAPAFSLTILLTIALAIAGNTVIFSVVNAILVQPLPFRDSAHLVQVAEKNDRLHLPTFTASVLNFASWRERAHAFDELAAIGFGTFNLGGNNPEQLSGNRLSPALMPMLGISPVTGRGFTNAEEQPGAPAVAMLGERLWARRFGRDASIVGRTIILDGSPVTVVGIAPASLTLFSGGDVYVPLVIDPPKEIRLNHVVIVSGRLKPGVTVQQAQAECDVIAADVQRTYPEMKDWGINLVSYFDTFVSPQLKTALLVLLAAVGCVLLIACANITNLLLSRATARQKEIAVRAALGASRSRVLRQLLVESILLSSVGGGLGIVAAVGLVRVVNASLPPNFLPVLNVRVDATVLVFGVVLAVLTGVMFGLAPAWYAAKTDVHDMLNAAGRGQAGGRSRLRSVLAASELALATVLLIGAALLVRTFLNLEHARLGFDPSRLLTFQVSLPTAKYPPADKALLFHRSMLESLRAIPGVRDAAVSSAVPFGQGSFTRSPNMPASDSALPPDTAVPTDWRLVSPGYFTTMGIPLVRGRDFTDQDGPTSPLVTIVSEAAAKTFWGDRDPVGLAIKRPNDNRTFTVVGMAGDTRNLALNQESPTLYFPAGWRAFPLMDVVIRSDTAPALLIAAAREHMRALDADLPLANVRTMDELIATTAMQPRLSAELVAVFAVLAAIIAAVGIYGVLAYSVNQRTREIGLRLALGANVGGVLRMIVKEGMAVAGVGIAVGVLAALALGRAVASLVYGVAPRDPGTFIGVAGSLVIVALAASWIPAKRAARVDPIIALKED